MFLAQREIRRYFYDEIFELLWLECAWSIRTHEEIIQIEGEKIEFYANRDTYKSTIIELILKI